MPGVLRCPHCGASLRYKTPTPPPRARCPKCQSQVSFESAPLTPQGFEAEGAERLVSGPSSTVTSRPEAQLERARRDVPQLIGEATTLLSIRELRDRREPIAKGFLIALAVPVWIVLALWTVTSMGIGLIIIGFVALIRLLSRVFMLAYIKTNAVRASPKQLPEIYDAGQKVCARLGIRAPDIYVLQENTWNAFAAKLAGKRVVVLLTGAIDSILLTGDFAQLTWLVGHEIGHHVAGHLSLIHI